MLGTEIVISGVADAAIAEAKGFFLRFSKEEVLETTNVGQILRRSVNRPARICVKGILVAEEPNFAFSYNVTALTQAMRKALNRERTHVGRTTYGDRVEVMLLAAESASVANVLAKDLPNIVTGTSCEEVRNWNEVGLRACQILNAARRVMFVTGQQRTTDKELVDRAIEDGLDVITVPATIAAQFANVKILLESPSAHWGNSSVNGRPA